MRVPFFVRTHGVYTRGALCTHRKTAQASAPIASEAQGENLGGYAAIQQKERK
jgi:hypothetical protein